MDARPQRHRKGTSVQPFNAKAAFVRAAEERLGLATYVKIVDYVRDPAKNVASGAEAPDFQKTFNGYYGIRKDAGWRKNYYAAFQKFRTGDGAACDFPAILEAITGSEGCVSPSFASKMLASLDADRPLWDSRVVHALGVLGRKAPQAPQGTRQQRMEAACEGYRVLEETCLELLAGPVGEQAVQAFDGLFGHNERWRAIAPMKKLDFALWCAGG